MTATIELKSTNNDAVFRRALTQGQANADAQLDAVLKVAPVVGLIGTVGLGKSLLLQAQVEKRNGRLITLRDIADASAGVAPLAYADAFNELVKEALAETDFVAVDDLGLFVEIGRLPTAERGGYTPMVAKQLFEMVTANANKRLLLAGPPPDQWGKFFLDPLMDRGAMVTLEPPTSEDYAIIARNILGVKVNSVDFRQVYRHASRLTCHQLCLASELLRDQHMISADDFIETLDRHVISSNVRTREVEDITFDSLPGTEYIAETLEAAIVLPLENRELAQEMGLKPKRGVLLYGPPGTGKTAMGRALAHRMKGKFFLVDGSVISEPPGTFFNKLQSIVAEAKANAPSVIFIDDADVLFKIEHIQGVVRFLLSLLDGLESETANNVCVMMTAMDVKLIPNAVLRSGRVEVWLQTKLPDTEVRVKILKRYLAGDKHLPEIENVDYDGLAATTAGFTQADLRRVATDARALYASDLVKKRPVAKAIDYLLGAVESMIEIRGRMADCLGDQTLKLSGGKSKYFNKAAASSCGETCGY